MDNEEIVKKFVEKRNYFRKFSILAFALPVIIAIIGYGFFAEEIRGAYSDMYISVIGVCIFWSFIIDAYVGVNLSKCPVCHRVIPTTRAGKHNNGPLRPGNGPLPRNCPYCGTNFSRYNGL